MNQAKSLVEFKRERAYARNRIAKLSVEINAHSDVCNFNVFLENRNQYHSSNNELTIKASGCL